MSDHYMRKILAATMVEDKSIEEISKEKMIPVSTCYRRVHELVGLRLLRIERTVITETGKKYETYMSAFTDAKIRMTSGDLAVEVTMNSRMK